MRYFITGATGFIGGALARQLREAGHDVLALVRDLPRGGGLAELGVELAQGDVVDAGTLRAAMGGADGVFHVAAWYKVGVRGQRDEAERCPGASTPALWRSSRTLAVPSPTRPTGSRGRT